ncbi:MAG: flagellar assembly protein FliW [Deltaproteobacteria bacterium]
MEIMTTRFGTLDIEEGKILTFTHGIPGFADKRRFILIPHGEESPFFWLQCLDDPDLAFPVLDPAVILSDYSFEIPDGIQEELGITRQEQVQVLVIVTVPRENPRKMTANLLGPVVLNVETMTGCQIVLDHTRYPLKYPLFKEDS